MNLFEKIGHSRFKLKLSLYDLSFFCHYYSFKIEILCFKSCVNTIAKNVDLTLANSLFQSKIVRQILQPFVVKSYFKN